MASDGMIVHIPGPQILGDIQPIIPVDNSTPHKATESVAQDPGEMAEDKAGGELKRGFQPEAPQDCTRFNMMYDRRPKVDGTESDAVGNKSHGAALSPVDGAEDGDEETARARKSVKAISLDEKLAKAVKEMVACMAMEARKSWRGQC